MIIYKINFFKRNIDKIISIITISIILLSCEKKISSPEKQGILIDTISNQSAKLDSLRFLDSIKKYDIYPVIHYKLINLDDRKSVGKLSWKYRKSAETMANYRALTTLNRKELRFFGVGNKIIVPDTVLEDLKAYSVFPQYYPAAEKLKKLILISNKYQCYACYEHGKLVRFAAANTGKESTPTFPGRYALNWKDKLHRSSQDSSWVMPFTINFHTEAGNAFHQFVMPGRPVSHSCIRQFIEDAEWLFYWGEGIKRDSNKKFVPLSGTPVIIVDYFDFNIKRGGPWLDLKSNKDAKLKLPDNPMAVEEALIPIIQIPQESRGNLRNKKRYLIAEDTLRARGVIRPGVKLFESVNFNKTKRLKALKEAKLKKKHEEMKEIN